MAPLSWRASPPNRRPSGRGHVPTPDVQTGGVRGREEETHTRGAMTTDHGPEGHRRGVDLPGPTLLVKNQLAWSMSENWRCPLNSSIRTTDQPSAPCVPAVLSWQWPQAPPPPVSKTVITAFQSSGTWHIGRARRHPHRRNPGKASSESDVGHTRRAQCPMRPTPRHRRLGCHPSGSTPEAGLSSLRVRLTSRGPVG